MLDIPNRLNGYNIIAHAPVVNLAEGRIIQADVRAILGHDPSRRYPKYVTALVSDDSIINREWFWGHYFEGTSTPLRDAMVDFMIRAGITTKELADANR